MMKTSQQKIDYIKRWQKANPEKFKAYCKKYKTENRAKIRERERERYPEIKDRKNTRRRERRANDPKFKERHDKYKEYWEQKLKTGINETPQQRGRRYYFHNRERRLFEEYNRNKNRRFEVIYWYSNGEMCCAKCGERRIEFLSIDHINNNGKEERRLHKGNFIGYLVCMGFPEGYQILCHNCNQIKERELRFRKNPSAPYHKYRDHVKKDMLLLYSDGTMKCSCCGFSDIRALTFNHINGKGTEESRLRKEKTTCIYLYRLGYKRDDINVLCYNCNSAEGFYGGCPHKSLSNHYV